MNTHSVAQMPSHGQPTIPQTRRMQPSRIRQSGAFAAARLWIYSCLITAGLGHDPEILLDARDIPASLDQPLDESTLAAVRRLDPMASAAALGAAVAVIDERLDVFLTMQQMTGKVPSHVRQDFSAELARAVLAAHHGSLVHGTEAR